MYVNFFNMALIRKQWSPNMTTILASRWSDHVPYGIAVNFSYATVNELYEMLVKLYATKAMGSDAIPSKLVRIGTANRYHLQYLLRILLSCLFNSVYFKMLKLQPYSRNLIVSWNKFISQLVNLRLFKMFSLLKCFLIRYAFFDISFWLRVQI